jgi:hypothetical protein
MKRGQAADWCLNEGTISTADSSCLVARRDSDSGCSGPSGARRGGKRITPCSMHARALGTKPNSRNSHLPHT